MKGGRSKPDTRSSTDDSLSVNKKASPPKRGRSAYKNLTKPRMPSAYFVFMEGFIKEYMITHRKTKDRTLDLITGASEKVWESKDAKAKESYQTEAKERMIAYERNMQVYNKRLETVKLHKRLSPFSIFREEFLKNKSDAYIKEICKKWDDMPDPEKYEYELRKNEPDPNFKEMSEQWEAKTESEKAPYVSKAKENMVEYERNIIAFGHESDESDSEGPSEKMAALPTTGFLLFLEQFLMPYTAMSKNIPVDAVKDLSNKWKSMNEHEKAPYISDAEKRMMDYEAGVVALYCEHCPMLGSDEMECEGEPEAATGSEETQPTTGLLIFLDEFESTWENDPADNPVEFMEKLYEAWKSMADDDKKVYIDEARKVMIKYEETAVEHYQIMLYGLVAEKPEVSEETVPAATGLLLFLDAFFKKNPEDKSDSKTAELTETWRSMTDGDKAPYNDEAAKCMLKYEEDMKVYFEALDRFEKNLKAYSKKLDEESKKVDKKSGK